MARKTTYEVTIATHKTRAKKGDSLADALSYAKRQAREESHLTPPMVWDVQSQLIIAIVTDDANGLTLRRLVPESWVTDKEKLVWNAADSSPEFNRQPR